MDLIYGVTYDREDTCPICRRKRALDLYDKHDRPVRFPLILDRDEINRLYNRTLYYFKCSICNEEFRIDWSQENGIPVPLIGNKLRYFLEDYINSYENNS